VSFETTLHELGDGLFAYIQGDGGWGFSNAGLVTAPGTSMLIDTTFDRRCAERMLAELAPITSERPIESAANTHGNGDHCFGNASLPDRIPVYATKAADDELRVVTPQVLTLLEHIDDSAEWRSYWARTFGRFDFAGTELRLPTDTFAGRLDVKVGDREVAIIEVGPAHTAGDAILVVPDAETVFTGDILFSNGTPIVWQGPIQNWLDACEQIESLHPRTLVPGHGPLRGTDGLADTKRYLNYIRDQARARHAQGMSAAEAADDIDISDFRDWGDPERIVVNVETAYRELEPGRPSPPPPDLFLGMARWAARH
jgi:glyoxylase-like metal-dependent hydrolase (beta-lactamase superfamily II)